MGFLNFKILIWGIKTTAIDELQTAILLITMLMLEELLNTYFLFPSLFLCSRPKVTETAQQRLQEDCYINASWFYKTIISSYPKFCINANTSGLQLCEKGRTSALQHSSFRRKRGKCSTATDFMYLNSLFWLAEMSCSQSTGTASQLSATLHCTFPSKHEGAVSLTTAWKDLYRTAWLAGYFIQLRVGWGTKEISTCNTRQRC